MTASLTKLRERLVDFVANGGVMNARDMVDDFEVAVRADAKREGHRKGWDHRTIDVLARLQPLLDGDKPIYADDLREALAALRIGGDV